MRNLFGKASSRKLFLVAVATGSMALVNNVFAEANNSTSQQQLLEEVRALRAEVNELKAQKSASQPSASPASVASPAQSDADLRRAIQVDADNHQPFNMAALSAITGYDGKGFVLSDESGNNTFRPGYILQARNVANWRQNAHYNFGTKDDFQDGWEIRRAKIYLTGNLLSPNLTYRFQMANQVNGPSFVLDDAWMAYKFLDGDSGKFSFKVGQFKAPVDHEEYEVGDEKQLAAERSLVNDILGGGAIGPRTQGIELLWNSKHDVFHSELLLHDGSGNSTGAGGSYTHVVNKKNVTTVLPGNTPANPNSTAASSVNSNFQDLRTPYSPIFGTAGRFEWKAFGDWNEYTDFTARATKKDTLIFGGGLDYTEAVNADYYHAEVDAQYKSPIGFSVYGALLGDYTDFRNVTGFNNNFDYGAIVQAGYAINHKIEPFVRADLVKLDNDFVAVHDIISEFTVGVNYYFGPEGSLGHHAKFTIDGTYLPIGSGPVNRLNEDYLTSGNRNEFVIQTQFQLWL